MIVLAGISGAAPARKAVAAAGLGDTGRVRA